MVSLKIGVSLIVVYRRIFDFDCLGNVNNVYSLSRHITGISLMGNLSCNNDSHPGVPLL